MKKIDLFGMFNQAFIPSSHDAKNYLLKNIAGFNFRIMFMMDIDWSFLIMPLSNFGISDIGLIG